MSLKRYAGKLDIQYLVGLTLAETVAAVRALPSGAVVLYLTVFRDGSGAMPAAGRRSCRQVLAVWIYRINPTTACVKIRIASMIPIAITVSG